MLARRDELSGSFGGFDVLQGVPTGLFTPGARRRPPTSPAG